MKTALLTVAGLAFVASALAAPAAAQSDSNNWRVVGYKTVGGHDSDTIQLPGDRRFRQIRLCAYNQPIRMRDLDVRFANGRKQDVEVRNRINPGTCTRNIDLEGDRRDIASIRMRYEPITRTAQRPLIRVQAR
jgi:hypothetical protein